VVINTLGDALARVEFSRASQARVEQLIEAERRLVRGAPLDSAANHLVSRVKPYQLLEGIDLTIWGSCLKSRLDLEQR
jgi:hypothetical protein